MTHKNEDVSLFNFSEFARKVIAKLEVVEKSVCRNNETLYGTTVLGEPRGGLVNYVHETRKALEAIKENQNDMKAFQRDMLEAIRKNSDKKSYLTTLTGRDRTAVYVSVITSVSAILVALISCFK